MSAISEYHRDSTESTTHLGFCRFFRTIGPCSHCGGEHDGNFTHALRLARLQSAVTPDPNDVRIASVTTCHNMRDWMRDRGTLGRNDDLDVLALLNRASAAQSIASHETFVRAAATILLSTQHGLAAWDAVRL